MRNEQDHHFLDGLYLEPDPLPPPVGRQGRQLGSRPLIDYYSDDPDEREWALDLCRHVLSPSHAGYFIHEDHDGQPAPGSVIELRLQDRKGGDITEFPADLQVREFP